MKKVQNWRTMDLSQVSGRVDHLYASIDSDKHQTRPLLLPRIKNSSYAFIPESPTSPSPVNVYRLLKVQGVTATAVLQCDPTGIFLIFDASSDGDKKALQWSSDFGTFQFEDRSVKWELFLHG